MMATHVIGSRKIIVDGLDLSESGAEVSIHTKRGCLTELHLILLVKSATADAEGNVNAETIGHNVLREPK